MEPDSASNPDGDVELLRRIGRGDRASFQAFYDRMAGTLFAIALRLLNNREAAEDVLQEVFVQIWEKAPLYDPNRGKPSTWAVTLTRNKAIDRMRMSQRRTRLSEALEHEADADPNMNEPSSFESAILTEQGRLVREAMRELSPEQKETLELAFFESLSQAEIAAKLGEPLGTVKARIRRGMAKLRELLAPRL